MIIVANVHKLVEVPTGYARIYVGRRTSYRPEFGEDFSALGNPYGMRTYTRDEAVDLYVPWLARAPRPARSALDTLRERARTESLALLCYCAPQRCHADVIRETLCAR